MEEQVSLAHRRCNCPRSYAAVLNHKLDALHSMRADRIVRIDDNHEVVAARRNIGRRLPH
jgi:hypothetical protein